MGIFSRIKSAIFGQRSAPATPSAGGAAAAQPHVTPTVQSGAGGHNRPTPHPQTTGNEPLPAGTSAQSAPAAPAEPVDVEAVLEEKSRHAGQQLNWRSSIVDLLKLLDIDSDLAARKELAEELGYTGATDGSAEMNIWLHKAVMRALEQNGGKVPASLKD